MGTGNDPNIIVTPYGELYRIRERGTATREQIETLLRDLPLGVRLQHKFNPRPHAGRHMEPLEVRVNGSQVELRPPTDIIVAAVRLRPNVSDPGGIQLHGFETCLDGGHILNIILDRRVRKLDWPEPSDRPFLSLFIYTWPR